MEAVSLRETTKQNEISVTSRLPCIFRDVSSLTNEALPQIKAYRTGYLNMPILFKEHELLSFPRSLKFEGLNQLSKVPTPSDFLNFEEFDFLRINLE